MQKKEAKEPKEHSKEGMAGLKEMVGRMMYGKKKKMSKKIAKYVKEEEQEA